MRTFARGVPKLAGCDSRRPPSCSRARTTSSSQLVTFQYLLNQRREDGFVQRRKLQQTGVQPLQLCLRHGVWIHTWSGLGRADSLQPTKQDLGSTGIGDRALT